MLTCLIFELFSFGFPKWEFCLDRNDQESFVFDPMIQLEYAVENLQRERFSFGKICFLKTLNIIEKKVRIGLVIKRQIYMYQIPYSNNTLVRINPDTTLSLYS